MPKLKEAKKLAQKEEKKNFDLTYVFIGAAALLVIGFIYFVFFVPPGGNGTPVIGDLSDNDPFKGPVNAKVKFVDFSDFQCPACGTAYPVLKRLMDEYSDRVKFVYRDFPLTQLHPFAQKAAEAAQCAFDQGKFWEYHDKLFENQQKLAIADLKQYALDLGLDSTQFNSCLDSAKNAGEVSADFSAGKAIGVNGTPTFFINGTKYSNMSFEQFKQVLEQELAKP